MPIRPLVDVARPGVDRGVLSAERPSKGVYPGRQVRKVWCRSDDDGLSQDKTQQDTARIAQYLVVFTQCFLRYTTHEEELAWAKMPPGTYTNDMEMRAARKGFEKGSCCLLVVRRRYWHAFTGRNLTNVLKASTVLIRARNS
jgi:hypothetical protein